MKFVQGKDLSLHFSDYSAGAIPAVRQAYNLSLIWYNYLGEQPDFYIEGGDHEALLHLDKEEFLKLMADEPHTIISERH